MSGDASDEGGGDALSTLRGLSAEAFALAKAAASDASGDAQAGEARIARAREIRAELDSLVAVLHELGPDHEDEVRDLDGDARLDCGYVLSGGATPTSLRLAHVLPRPAANGP